MNHLKLILLLFSLTLCNCSQYLKVIEATKSKHVSGLKNGRSYIDYGIKIEAKNSFSIQNIRLEDKTIKESLYVKDLATGLSSTQLKKEYKKGTYLVGFRIFNRELISAKETIELTYITNKKKYILNTFVLINDAIFTNK